MRGDRGGQFPPLREVCGKPVCESFFNEVVLQMGIGVESSITACI